MPFPNERNQPMTEAIQIFVTHTAVNVTNVSTQLLAASDVRRWVLLVNDSVDVIYVSFNVPAVLNTGIRLNPNGGSLELALKNGTLDMRAINAIHGAGVVNRVMLVSEGI